MAKHAKTATEYLLRNCCPNPFKMTNGKQCVEWVGSKSKAGYGKGTFKGKFVYAHRLSYETFVGPIPPELEIDHLCVNPACIQPAHLEPVTRAENWRRVHERKQAQGRTYRRDQCNKGHPFTPENILTFAGDADRGVRRCKTCYEERSEMLRAQRKEQKGGPL